MRFTTDVILLRVVRAVFKLAQACDNAVSSTSSSSVVVESFSERMFHHLGMKWRND